MIDSKSKAGLIRATIIVVLMMCLCVAALFLVNSYSLADIGLILESELLLPAVLLQIISIMLFIQAWKFLLSMDTRIRFSFLECTSHIGVTLMGKYIPGKIWGLVGRSYLLTRRGHSKSDAVNLLVADQFLTFYSGIAVGTIVLLAYFSGVTAIATLLVFVVCSPYIIKSYDSIIQRVFRWSKLFLKRLSAEIEPEVITIHRTFFGISLLSYLIHWLLISLVLCLLFYPVIAFDLPRNSLLIVAAIPLAMLSGFIALWAPGGVGVREAVIVLILSLNLPVKIALSVAITYRLLCVLNDLCTGCFAVYFFSRSGSSLIEK
ncbi:MAG: lysylphosphatidylglycerol synthase transmembrane domain-containing protein [Gammaproteobacteria bacterium]|jgi:uncharacterized membrane protein YbhN (UPF0104 family)|nr:lysylphosphatidylglycerol synthase transmembrane domain-containing protein [Gammaproteobacteria bacterium]MDP6534818.1 lysylphosphatidylglycerol synthase transmembrane domain-containing protein [Gammaproteobacteria bacterium]MDP6732231.1 lysylphosphatidylglycerol synthase transmembrane domain-containing protein [Gammaproteobacteria bacterium]HAJ76136.1 hypothetical protein [Gammaproteobacteria bacterium]|tara:strand:- start:12337 stop:13293 length:957 start_codon:yes stop_codon:yes gene_type:complete